MLLVPCLIRNQFMMMMKGIKLERHDIQGQKEAEKGSEFRKLLSSL